jgi:cation transport ATPase
VRDGHPGADRLRAHPARPRRRHGERHPLGRAILERAGADGIPLRPAKDSRGIPGKAVEAVATGKCVTVGSPSHAAGQAALPPEAERAVATWEIEGKTVHHPGRDPLEPAGARNILASAEAFGPPVIL